MLTDDYKRQRVNASLIGRVQTVALLGLLLVTPPAVGYASISVSQSIDRSEMAFEDTAGFQISVTWDGPAHAYRFDKPFRVSSDRFTVARFSSTVRSAGSGESEVTTKFFDYLLTPNLSGAATIEALNIEYVTWPDSLTGILVTDPVSVFIREPSPREPGEEGGLSGGWYAVIAVCLLGLAVGLYAILKPRASPEAVQTASERFLEDLEESRREAGSDLKKYQTGLYRCLVTYVESRYGLSAAGRSVADLTAELNQAEVDPAVAETLSGWLRRAEREKYAPVAVAPGEVTRLDSEVKQFFRKIK